MTTITSFPTPRLTPSGTYGKSALRHTAPLSDLEHMVYGVTNQQVAQHRVSFDLGVLDHFRALEQRRITATVRYEPHNATCTPVVQTTINGQVAALERMYVHSIGNCIFCD